MTDPSVIAAAVVTVIAAVAGGTVTVVNAIAAAQDREDQRTYRAQMTEVTRVGAVATDVLTKKTEEIHQLADGNLTRVTQDLRMATQEIQSLREMVTSLVEAKKVADALTAPPKVH